MCDGHLLLDLVLGLPAREVSCDVDVLVSMARYGTATIRGGARICNPLGFYSYWQGRDKISHHDGAEVTTELRESTFITECD